ncbi:MAG: flagellar hook assembly protein FlgD [Hyphomicrobium sp.]|uniref:flagellar hook assembly protein FlgD n=1 Tax=Hyphomicrobium sp. TaxID=82 RepID=UPI00132490D3|nr:flagellar hook assembly protein FlgD [Hyphomicrobium sp.]KAB2943262.1 MAG: flagellar hook assembly protein FlgD [Hyphomicrobium sp.]MBZ0210380.1 flagellar hook assembly protein FlgD [Hyphomicrobium sp.]MCZ7594041.1 flagellar hook assembly protein FlgD [Hyphomicrobium sp.]
MQVSTTTPTALQNNTQTSQTNGTSAASLDYTAFLRLLIAQMQNQDPTDPADPAEWMGQIASFSNVEQAIQTNAKLDALMTSMALSQVDGLIGHTVTAGDGSVSGKVASVRIITGGAVAILENGKELLLGEGVKVS